MVTGLAASSMLHGSAILRWKAASISLYVQWELIEHTEGSRPVSMACMPETQCQSIGPEFESGRWSFFPCHLFPLSCEFHIDNCTSLETVNSILAGIFQVYQNKTKLPDGRGRATVIPTGRVPGDNSCTHALMEGKLFSLQKFSFARRNIPGHPCHQCPFWRAFQYSW